jgi:hypothetical protein
MMSDAGGASFERELLDEQRRIAIESPLRIGLPLALLAAVLVLMQVDDGLLWRKLLVVNVA